MSPSRRLTLAGALAVAAAATLTAGPAALSAAPATATGSSSAATHVAQPSSAVRDCSTLLPGTLASGARTRPDSLAQEPDVTRGSNAQAYGVLKSFPMLAPGSVTVPVIFHVTSDHVLTAAERARYETMIAAQMDVMNASYGGQTGARVDTPFRWRLASIDYTVNADYYTVVPGKVEKAMKSALHQGDSRTLNVYTGNIGDGLLGWAYFPKDGNPGRDYLDGIVMLDESMPGGTAGKYALGDTLVHEAGHWLGLYHTFQGGCTWSNDFVADTPAEAHPQFNCPEGADSCDAPGLDPIHNFMDYTQDSCMDTFTPGQAKRMSDSWQYFRAPAKS
ncbi:zinc metalloprotease [Arsenicicoccus sp. oral taxon 190]|uniref:zinc metalloprotease n=1 Tax=Arsenicicoccus sp. oral taxon 190 TaxID=1658671 RepID=UPI00067A3E37|nr:zinc metalloprotease [Arsenicicoccus sp. oral taxon 190]AKT52004.1 peptidase [Arsenicicoccus sp. oral taxon 190]